MRREQRRGSIARRRRCLGRLVHIDVIDGPADEVGHVKDDEPLGEEHEHVCGADRVVEFVFELQLDRLGLLLAVAVVVVAC